MKKEISFAVVLISFLLITVDSSAQEKSTLLNPEQYLFPAFNTGKVGMKNGRELKVNLNYNIVTEKMVFMQKGLIYDMTDFANVDTVTLLDKKFIAAGKGFMEITDKGKYTLLFQHIGKIETPPRPAAYGGTSEVSNSTYINNVKIGNEVYRLQNDPDLVIKREVFYWIKTSDRLENFLNEKQLVKIMPDLKDKIRLFIKQNKIKFDDPQNVIKLINYCNTL